MASLFLNQEMPIRKKILPAGMFIYGHSLSAVRQAPASRTQALWQAGLTDSIKNKQMKR
jgi:hypothetical protein